MAKNESIFFENFQLGRTYSRQEIARVGRVTEPSGSRDPHWAMGIIPFSNAVLLLVTLDKANKPDYAYEDRFDGPMPWWQSQNQQTQQAPVIKRIASGDEPVLLFTRTADRRKGRTLPFVYCGRLVNPAMEGE
jgi:hypothetical protein